MRTYLYDYKLLFLIVLFGILGSCKTPNLTLNQKENKLPNTFHSMNGDTVSVASIDWRTFFQEKQLIQLIDSALVHNQELNIVLQEIAIQQSEVLEKKGEYQPFVNLGLGSGTEKVGRYTRNGSVEHNLEIDQDKEFPEPLSDFIINAKASWEIDIWKKLRNAKDAEQLRYLAENEGRNFLVTQLVAEITQSYYELMALDNLLVTINQNISLQESALEKTKALKENAKATQLAVNRFEAQLLNTNNQKFEVQQRIAETENKLYYLTGAYRGSIERNSTDFMNIQVDTLSAGLTAQLLENRPDVRRAELEIQAADLDVKVAKANFYPKLELKAGLGFQAFNPSYLVHPESLIYDVAGDLVAPLINRKAIQAQFNRASAAQLQRVFSYQQTLLFAYTDVMNQLAKLDNYSQSWKVKTQEVELLKNSVQIANSLFQNAKADYVEVLLTQEEVLDAQLELIEVKLKQVEGKVQLYRALGGGWR